MWGGLMIWLEAADGRGQAEGREETFCTVDRISRRVLDGSRKCEERTRLQVVF